MNVRGSTITRVLFGQWRDRPGVDMPGVAGPIWQYCDIILELDGEVLLLVVPGKTQLLEKTVGNYRHLESSLTGVESCVGQRIRDIIEVQDEPMVLVLLADGRHLESSYQPGGTFAQVSTFSEWHVDVLRESSYKSWVTGTTGKLDEIARVEG